MIDGIIEIDTERALPLGFTSKKFALDSYLWKKGDSILISLIISNRPGRGDFSTLVRTIEKQGFKVIVPCPLGRMTAILKNWGFKMDRADDGTDLWSRP